MADLVTLRDDYSPCATVKIDGRGRAVVQRKKTSTNGDIYTVMIDGIDFEVDFPAERLSFENATPSPDDKLKKEDLPVIRVIMIGKTGAGKSYLGNALLGRKEFTSSVTAASVTTSCAWGKQEITSSSRKYMLKVIDTPGLKDNRFPAEKTCAELLKSLSLSLPGPHFFIIVVQIGRFTEEELDVVKLLKREFGDELMNFALVVFTHGSKLNDTTIEDYLEIAPPALRQVLKDSQNRYAVLGDKDQKDMKKSVQKIIDLIVNSVELRYYTNEMFKQADENKKMIIARLEEERNRELNMLKGELEELKRKEGERCSKEEKKQIKEEKQRKMEELKKTENTSSEEKYDDKVTSDDSVVHDTFAGNLLTAVGGIIETGVGFFTGNAVVAGQGMMTAARSVMNLFSK